MVQWSRSAIKQRVMGMKSTAQTNGHPMPSVEGEGFASKELSGKMQFQNRLNDRLIALPQSVYAITKTNLDKD